MIHPSGITPAVSAQAGQAALDAAHRAKEKGLTVVFDGNFRSALWRTRNVEPGPILRKFFACVGIVFVNDRDIGLVLNRDFSGESAKNIGRVSADAAFTAFPQLARIMATQRMQHNVDRRSHRHCRRLAAGALHGVCSAT